MNLKTTSLLIWSFITQLFSPSLFSQPLDLAGEGWRFQKGDDLAWVKPEFDDANWQNIAVGMPWESALQIEYDGWAWYRRSIVISQKDYKKAIRKYGSMILSLGMIDDADETYFNGVKIGSTGKLPPDTLSAWDTPRKYLVPAALIRWDEPNVIAVRVFDDTGGGGLHGGEYHLEPTTWKNQFQIQIENGETSNAFALNQPIIIKSQLVNNSDQKLEGTLTCEVKTFTGKHVEKQAQAVKIGRGRRTLVPDFKFTSPSAGFYISYLTFKDNKGYSVKDKKGFAIAPETLKPAPTRPADFDLFWASTLTELASVEPHYQITLLPQYTTSKVEVFEIEMHSLNNVRVKGYYTKPKEKTNIPAVLHVQGYSSIMLPFGLDENMSAFYLNIRGHGNSRDDVNPGFPGYLLSGLSDKNQYIYRGAYMDCIRAMDFLCSRDEVDTTRLAVEGGSQGGALSIATASLDKRVKFCLPDVPFLSNFRLYFDIASWPAGEFKMHHFKTGKKWEDIYGVLDYIDVTNHAPNVSCPVIMGVGLFDDVCPAAINFSAYNNLSTQDKTYHLYPNSGHSLPETHYGVKMKWLYERFGLK
jgi:cephalosporin-C deacetylase